MKRRLSFIAAALSVLACLSGAVRAQERLEHRGRDPAPAHAERLQLDQRYHHDHYYPPRGYAVPILPRGSTSIGFRGNNYFFHGGVSDAQVFQRAVAACMDGRGYTVR